MNQNVMMFLSLCGALVFGQIHKTLALRKGRNANRWFWTGFFFGALGLPFIFFAPSLRKKELSPAKPLTLPKHPLCQKMWYYLDANQSQIGPMSFLAFAEAHSKNLFTQNSYAWNEDFSDWKLVKDLPVEILNLL